VQLPDSVQPRKCTLYIPDPLPLEEETRLKLCIPVNSFYLKGDLIIIDHPLVVPACIEVVVIIS
jgi:hypothetical protein